MTGKIVWVVISCLMSASQDLPDVVAMGSKLPRRIIALLRPSSPDILVHVD
ncbi:MAG TPA: hypothetical protein G4O15_11815 [Dehalococcoidia bacterium]|nr:hypothetical protein [Dehalococcoidia bacterium]